MMLQVLVAALAVAHAIASPLTGRPCGKNSTVKQGHRNLLYVTNWGIYGAGYSPDNLPVKDITHVLYAFADIKPNGTVVSSDPWADTGKPFGNESTTGPGHNAHGLVKQLYLKKMTNRNMKVILSIGGYNWSPKFDPVAADKFRRATFVSSAIKLMADFGMDGIDIDYEYPNTTEKNQKCVKLLSELRLGLVDFSAKNAGGHHFTLGFPAPAGPQNYKAFDFQAMDKSLDFWSLMAFDFAGAWENTTGHQSNVFRSKRNPQSTNASVERAFEDYVGEGGISPAKMNLGMPLYGRAFSNTKGPGKSYSGLPNGTLGQAGIYLYKDLPRPGVTVRWDSAVKARYSYNNVTQELVTFDDMRSAKYKQAYIKRKKLGGAMFWEATGDKAGDENLVRSMAKGMGKLGQSQNLLSYPSSQYDNIRNGMKSNSTLTLRGKP